MSEEPQTRRTLIQRITGKRADIQRFLAKAEPRKARLVNVAIYSSAIAAAFTAGPAFGGQPLTAWMTETIGLAAPVWQVLCLLATASSVTAAIATNMSKSNDMEKKILQAQTTDSKLEALETLIEMDQVDIEEASSLYVGYLGDVAFLKR